MAIHTPSIGAPVHAPHVSGWAVAAAAAVLVIGGIIVIQPKWAPSTTTTADEAAAAQQAYRGPVGPTGRIEPANSPVGSDRRGFRVPGGILAGWW